jgi:hypothetical protein
MWLPCSTNPGVNGIVATLNCKKECHDPAMLPKDGLQIETLCISGIGLGKSVYTKKYLDEVETFQDCQGTWRLYFTETAELA